MIAPIDHLEARVLALPDADRARLYERLRASLPQVQASAEADTQPVSFFVACQQAGQQAPDTPADFSERIDHYLYGGLATTE